MNEDRNPFRHPGGRTCQVGLLMIPFVVVFVLARAGGRAVMRLAGKPWTP